MHDDLMPLHQWIYAAKILNASKGSRDIDTASRSGGGKPFFPGLDCVPPMVF